MSRFDAIEGDDYIFDRYAYLGLDPADPREKIESVIKFKRAGLHPDRLVGVDEELIRSANKARELTDSCAAYLLNDELRPLYDARLAWFKEHEPNVVSKDGHQIINLGKERLSIDFLINKDELDVTELIKRVQDMSGYSPKNLELFAKLYAAGLEDEDAQDAYRGALEAKWIYLTLLEDFAWSKAGIDSFKPSRSPLQDEDGYVEAVEQEIEVRHEAIRAAVGNRNEAIRIGMAKPPLLLADLRGDAATPAIGQGLNDDDLEKLILEAQKVFTDRTAWIKELAVEKQDVLHKLISLTRIEDLGIEVDISRPYYFHFMIGDKEGKEAPRQAMTFVLDNESHLTDCEEEVFGQKSVDELRAIGLQGAIVFHNKEVGQLILELKYAAERYLEKYVNAKPEEADRAHLHQKKSQRDVRPA